MADNPDVLYIIRNDYDDNGAKLSLLFMVVFAVKWYRNTIS